MPALFRLLSALWLVGFVIAGILIVAGSGLARFAVAGLALLFAAIGLTMATDAGGMATWLARSAYFQGSVRTPQALRSPKVARVWGAVCIVAGLAFAVRAATDPHF